MGISRISLFNSHNLLDSGKLLPKEYYPVASSVLSPLLAVWPSYIACRPALCHLLDGPPAFIVSVAANEPFGCDRQLCVSSSCLSSQRLCHKELENALDLALESDILLSEMFFILNSRV